MKKLGCIDWLTRQLHFQWQNENHNPDELVWVLSEQIQNQRAWDISDFFHPKGEGVEVFIVQFLAVIGLRLNQWGSVSILPTYCRQSKLSQPEKALRQRDAGATSWKLNHHVQNWAKAIQAGVSPNSSLYFILIG